jgi:hypothetical protein
MTMKKIIRYLTITIFLSFNWQAGFAAEGILSIEDSEAAAPDSLMAEVAVFKGIREGMTLSIALCELSYSCAPVASDDEVRQLITALDQRIDGLSQRQQSSDEPALADILIAYFDEREGFNSILEKIDTTEDTSLFGKEIDESELFGEEDADIEETAEKEAVDNVEEFDMFADEDEEL